NLARAAEYLQQCGLWIYASSSHAQKSLWEMDFKRPQAIIIGSEGKGVRPLLLKRSDEVFRIPQQGKTESLNVSVAAGIIMSEILKQRGGPKRT
ncbi:MAG: RNA methyltransferase, partial [Calditrichia bacterium]|nr:RNA methyltransferase [Calditrichia bacterium]